MSEAGPPSQLFQIYESDLAELERLLPHLCFHGGTLLDNRTRTQWRVVQRILTEVRWNYGPPTDMQIIPAGDGTQ